jgi:hypothetical protein
MERQTFFFTFRAITTGGSDRSNGTQLNWRLAGNTAGFGNVADGRPIWTANFTGGAAYEVLFYFPGDKNWWLDRSTAEILRGSSRATRRDLTGVGWTVLDRRLQWRWEGRCALQFSRRQELVAWVLSTARRLAESGGEHSRLWERGGWTTDLTADFTGTSKADILFYFPATRTGGLVGLARTGRSHGPLQEIPVGSTGVGRPAVLGV